MSLDTSQMKILYRNLVRANRFDQMMYRRITSGQLVGFYHPAEGATAPGVAAGSFLEQGDILNPTIAATVWRIPCPKGLTSNHTSPSTPARKLAATRDALRFTGAFQNTVFT